MAPINLAKTNSQLRRCYPVMAELRPHLGEAGFLAQVQREMETQAYRIAYLEDAGEVVAVAGYRMVEMLMWGRTLYVENLVTKETKRSGGYGSQLFDCLIEQAQAADCDQFHLDNGVQRYGAHRFYLHKGMDIASHHFASKLKD